MDIQENKNNKETLEYAKYQYNPGDCKVTAKEYYDFNKIRLQRQSSAYQRNLPEKEEKKTNKFI